MHVRMQYVTAASPHSPRRFRIETVLLCIKHTIVVVGEPARRFAVRVPVHIFAFPLPNVSVLRVRRNGENLPRVHKVPFMNAAHAVMTACYRNAGQTMRQTQVNFGVRVRMIFDDFRYTAVGIALAPGSRGTKYRVAYNY